MEPFIGLQSGPALDTPDRQELQGTLPSSVGDSMEWFGPTREAGNALERGAESVGAPANRPARAPPTYNPPADLITADEAEKKYGITGTLSFKDYSKGVSAAVAQNLYERGLERLARADVARRAPSGFLNTTARIGASFLAEGLDPLNVASAFIPVVGEARYAKWLLDAGSAAGRFGVRAGVGALRGAAGSVPLIAMHYGIAQEEQADYSSVDALLDLAYGAGLGGALHAGLGRLGDPRMVAEERAQRIRAAATETLGEEMAAPQPAPLADAVARAPLEVREGALRSAIAAVAEDRPVQSGLIFAAHEAQDMASLPVIARRDVELLAQEQDLLARAKELGPAPKALTRAEAEQAQGAAETLARVRQVEQDMANPLLDADQRKALSQRRDELLADTNHETLAEQAGVLEQRRTSDAQRAAIAQRLQEIAAERTRTTANAVLSGQRDLGQAVRDLAEARQRGEGIILPAREAAEGLSDDVAADLQEAITRLTRQRAELADNADQAVRSAAEPPLGEPGSPLPDPEEAAVQRAAEEIAPKGGPRTAADPAQEIKEIEKELADMDAMLAGAEKAGLVAPEEAAAIREADAGIALADAKGRGATAYALCMGKEG